jgi:hypothetical protein
MLNRVVAATAVFALLTFSPFAHAQTAAPKAPLPQHVDGYGRPVPDPVRTEKPGPAPVRDLAGIWEPDGWREGTQATGAKEQPADGKHSLPFTPEGEKAWRANKPGWGITAVPVDQIDDPFNICDPLGFPRVELFNLRQLRIYQAPKQLAILYENDQRWRNIWMDGREIPKEISEPRWFGYSVGKWVDDTTFVVKTAGIDPRTWIDNAGRPHSDQLEVEETFHRLNHDIIELTLTITDPVMYTKPWVALNKFRLRLQPDWFDIREMICSASEAAEYNTTYGANGSGQTGK